MLSEGAAHQGARVATRPNQSVFTAELIDDGVRVFGLMRLGPLIAVDAPLEAHRRLCGRRRCEPSLAAGPARVGGILVVGAAGLWAAKSQLTMACS